MWSIINLPTNTFEVVQSNEIVLSLQAEGMVSGQMDCEPPVQVPSPIIRHCLGFYPLAKLLLCVNPKKVAHLQSNNNAEAFAAHALPPEDADQVCGATTS